MTIKLIKGRLTSTQSKHIKYMLENGFTEAKINRFDYFLDCTADVYSCKIYGKNRGLGWIGSPLRYSLINNVEFYFNKRE